MGIKQIITDDLTGETLPDDVTPTVIEMGGEKYEVFLGPDSVENIVAFLKGELPLSPAQKPVGRKVDSFTTPIAGTETGDAAPSSLPRGAKTAYAGAKGEQMNALRAWAKGEGIELAEKGSPKSEVIEQFYKDNADLPVLIGRGALSIEKWAEDNFTAAE